jgi:hypothetical protein
MPDSAFSETQPVNGISALGSGLTLRSHEFFTFGGLPHPPPAFIPFCLYQLRRNRSHSATLPHLASFAYVVPDRPFTNYLAWYLEWDEKSDGQPYHLFNNEKCAEGLGVFFLREQSERLLDVDAVRLHSRGALRRHRTLRFGRIEFSGASIESDWSVVARAPDMK